MNKGFLIIAMLSLGLVSNVFADPVLKVDMNGGEAANQSPTSAGWQAWGGSSDKDHILPSNPDKPVPNIDHKFGDITVKITATGGSGTLNSRDRGAPVEPKSAENGADNGNMYRDLLFLAAGGGGSQGSNYLTVEIGGLKPNTEYNVSLYAYDLTGAHSMNWTAIVPAVAKGFDHEHLPEHKTIAWKQREMPPPDAAVVKVTTDDKGSVKVYGWGGSGNDGDSTADTSYLNGFAIDLAKAASTEPTTGPTTSSILEKHGEATTKSADQK
jgi:hypothetical protein